MPTVAPRFLLAVPAAAVFAVVTPVVALLAPTPLPAVVGLVVGVVAAAVTVWLLGRRAADAAVKRLGARPLDPDDEPRLASLVESVCASHGISEPRLYVADSRAPDAAVAGTPGDARLVVTTGALRQLDRLELEAVVARELSQFGSGVHAATLLVSISRLLGPLGASLRSALLDDRRLARIDVDGVRMTRYPPALVGVFEKVAAAEVRVPDDPATRHLWLIGPDVAGGDTAGAVQPPLPERIATLREL